MALKKIGWPYVKSYCITQKEIRNFLLMRNIQIFLKYFGGIIKKSMGGKTENLERSHSDTIRAGNVWVDVQQIFYRMEENVSGCYAQKPIKCIDRIVRASSSPNDVVIDFFAHSGTTLIVSEILKRKCFTIDIDPIYAEITIRRLERFRSTGRIGWQNGHPFEKDLFDMNVDKLVVSTARSQESLF